VALHACIESASTRILLTKLITSLVSNAGSSFASFPAIDIDASSKLAEIARGRLSEIAQKIFRSKLPGAERMDAVMYLIGAIEKFVGMSRQELQKIGIEIATLGTERFDVNDSREKYQVRSLPGRFSGLHMVCLMYAAFKIINPTADIGFDLANEYALAQQMKRDQRNT
jgi:hypothetical protein